MDKTYPPIDIRRHVKMSRAVFGRVYDPEDVETSRFQHYVQSTTSPNFPVLQENGFQSYVTKETWRPDYTYGYSPPDSRKWEDTIRNIDRASCPINDVPADIAAAVGHKALQRMYDKIPQATANLALLYAERKATLESLTQALGGIVKCMREVRRGRPPELFMTASQLKTRKKYSGAWLNYTYGIAPFAQDMYKLANTDPLSQVAYVKGKAGSPAYFAGPTYVGEGFYKETYKFGLSLSDPFIASLAQTGLLNPALIAWELTPFSFMADWVLPVGPYLEMLTATSGYTKHPGSITRVWKYEGSAWSTNSNAKHDVFYRSIYRHTQSFPDPPLPRFKNPLSPIHALNFLSIIHQFAKDR